MNGIPDSTPTRKLVRKLLSPPIRTVKTDQLLHNEGQTTETVTKSPVQPKRRSLHRKEWITNTLVPSEKPKSLNLKQIEKQRELVSELYTKLEQAKQRLEQLLLE
jgi:hypothetical protein